MSEKKDNNDLDIDQPRNKLNTRNNKNIEDDSYMLKAITLSNQQQSKKLMNIKASGILKKNYNSMNKTIDIAAKETNNEHTTNSIISINHNPKTRVK